MANKTKRTTKKKRKNADKTIDKYWYRIFSGHCPRPSCICTSFNYFDLILITMQFLIHLFCLSWLLFIVAFSLLLFALFWLFSNYWWPRANTLNYVCAVHEYCDLIVTMRYLRIWLDALDFCENENKTRKTKKKQIQIIWTKNSIALNAITCAWSSATSSFTCKIIWKLTKAMKTHKNQIHIFRFGCFSAFSVEDRRCIRHASETRERERGRSITKW